MQLRLLVRFQPEPPLSKKRRRCQISEPKVTILPYQSPRCMKCGRDLPRGRTRKCHYCLPPKGRGQRKKPRPDQSYTLEDRVAQADAYGLSYGKFQAILENGGQLPPLRHPVRWPDGSDHIGE